MSGKVIICFSVAALVSAQQMGHYLQGFAGLGSGAPLPSGTTVSYIPYLSRITSVKGPTGDTVIPANINVWANIAAVTFMVPHTENGLSFGFSAVAPWMSQRLQADILPVDKRATGYSDTIVMPFILGYTKGSSSILGNYAFVAPTGSFNPSSPANPGLGMWTHWIQLGAASSFGATKMWNTSVMSTWEMHTKKKGTDIHVGPGLTIEPAIGRRFLKGALNIGASGHYYQKLQADYGTGIRPAVRGLRDRAFGAGPEVQQ